MSIEKIATWIPVTDEAIVDYGIGTSEQQAAAAARIEEWRRDSQVRWQALPLRVRIARRLRGRYWGIKYRIAATVAGARAGWRGEREW
jgi:hypothetical protein